MHVRVNFVLLFSCVARGLEMGRSPTQGALPNYYKIIISVVYTELEKPRRPSPSIPNNLFQFNYYLFTCKLNCLGTNYKVSTSNSIQFLFIIIIIIIIIIVLCSS
jgi:hypothetical protein